MALLDIVVEGDDILRKKCKEVKRFDKDLAILLDDMYETMLKNNGCGIAAPQVGVLFRAFIIEIEGMKVEFINPTLSEMSGSCILKEGCLSVPNRSGYVERPTHVKISAFTRDGTPFTMILNDYPARVVCHENDHLDGILYIDKLANVKKSKVEKEQNQ